MKRIYLKRILLIFAAVVFAAAGFFAERPIAVLAQVTPTPTPTPPISDEDTVIKVDTEAVNVLFTAQDKSRRLLTSLRAEDVQVLENGQKQEIVAFTRQVDLPLSLAILIDTSPSQERTLPELKMAAISFLDSFVRPVKDEVSVVSFAGEATLEQGMTNNLVRLRRAIDRVKFNPPAGYLGGGVMSGGGGVPGTPPIANNQQIWGTALWDAVFVTADEVLGPAPEKTRRAIILLTDGVNYGGKKKLDDAVNAALRSEAVIYSIGIGDRYFDGVDTGALKKVSERTGGSAYFPRDEADLRSAFKQIEDEMRSQYLLAYEPSNSTLDGTYRKIEIQLVNPQLAKDKVRLTHRQGYFSKTARNK